ncbi:MAG: nicotinate phosphoribosyltransferase [Candidatus Muproteobacteria bacterium RBG_16_65_34]|uniref:Nicotinate phosphoribosyltransferase n=1 Tax=Candidatus Muproteobacteria bacterium RBG_16_65_34 TaxID=1817760 RepID=A0A1F6TP37_9PROT|nr:MAG: nicotinate phosphoribosyltransferase [Candidatus Muproteobacteria bacterium RBG_16_65_34]
MIDLRSSPLLTDLYQLTMLQAYLEANMQEQAVFEFFVRRLPPRRGFLLAAGLEQALGFIENLRFGEEELDWVRDCGRFSRELADYLAQLRFTGDVHAMPEGTAFFADEPILRVTAPMPQAQLLESRLINILHFETLIASKAARCVLAAPGKLLVDFGMRRAHGAEAGLFAARASYLAGFAGSSNVLAAPLYGIPVFGTVAHSFIQAHETEEAAFESFSKAHPGNVTLLIDTYDTEAGAHKVVRLAPRLKELGVTLRAVRLDSGDLAEHARTVREILDAGGLKDVQIFSSGNLDEYTMRDLLARGAPIDGFGVGTHMDVSADAPYLDCAYKLEEYAGRARRKRSEGKATWPGRKQVYRRYDTVGVMAGDVLTIEGDKQEGEALIQPAMRAGRRLAAPEPLEAIRARATAELARLPAHLRDLSEAPPYPVTIAPALRELAQAVDRDTMQN